MRKVTLLLMMLSIVLAGSAAFADVAYQPTIGLNDPAGDATGAAIADGTYAMILDRDGDGWGTPSNAYDATPLSVNADSWLWDTDDLMLDYGQIFDGMAFPEYYYTGDPTTEIPGYTAGVDSWYLLWFDVAYDEFATGPGAGVWYGAENLGVAGANGFTLNPDAMGGAAMFQTLGTTVVPEPISSVLALLGGGAMLLRRRFNFLSA